MEMSDTQLDFLNHYLDYLQTNYPTRYMQGIRKYKTELTQDYTAEELIDNLLEELMDGMAYGLAALKQIERKNAYISELEDKVARYENS